MQMPFTLRYACFLLLLKDLAPINFVLYSLRDTSVCFITTASTNILVEEVRGFEDSGKLGPRKLGIYAELNDPTASIVLFYMIST